MYIANKPPKRRTNIQIPQHVRKLIGQIQKTKEREDQRILSKILERFATIVTNDNVLMNIFNHFGWDENSRSFNKEISFDKLIELLEKEYEIRINELDLEPEENFLTVGTEGYPPTTSIGLNFNSSLSDSSNFIKNETPNDLFCVKKPIAISNSYGTDGYPINDPDFLTNSAKGWYQDTQREEDSSLISNWKTKTQMMVNPPGSVQGMFSKVLPLNVEKQTSLRTSRSNLFSTGTNYNIPDIKEEYPGYNDYMKTISGNKLGHNFHSNYSSSFTLGSNYTNNNIVPFNSNNANADVSKASSYNEELLGGIRSSVRKLGSKKKKTKRSKVKKVKTKIITNSFSPLKRKDRSYHTINQSRNSNFGLKEISKKVKEIVKNYKSTTYKEISDILVSGINDRDIKDEKNIRRRIYDSLNVMKAMKLFTKDKTTKRILWNGEEKIAEEDTKGKLEELSNFSFKKKKPVYDDRRMDVEDLTHRKVIDVLNLKNSLRIEIENKRNCYNNLSTQFDLLEKLVENNKARHNELGEEEKIKLPFIILEFPEHNSNINIISNESKTKLHFSLDNALRVYGDLDAISKLKMID